MALTNDICCALLRGNVKITDYPATAPVNPLAMPDGLLDMGEIGNLSTNTDIKEIRQASSKTLGGTGCYLSYTDRIKINLNVRCLYTNIMKIALQAGETMTTGAAQAAELHGVVTSCDLISLNFLPDLTAAIVVHDGPATVTYVEGTDYSIENGQILIIDGGAITAGSTIGVDYTSLSTTSVEALTAVSGEKTLVFESLNEAEDGHQLRVIFHRVRFNPLTSLELLNPDSDGFVDITLDGEVLASEYIKAANISKHYKIEWAK